MRRLLLIAVLLLAGGALAGDLDTLADWMTGSFASTEQAAADSAFFEFRLEMRRIWPDRTESWDHTAGLDAPFPAISCADNAEGFARECGAVRLAPSDAYRTSIILLVCTPAPVSRRNR